MILQLKQTPGIYLVGFMASGKTTIGRLLARHIGWEFADLDEDIERRHNAKIGELFKSLGEPGFREIEAEAMQRRVRAIKSGCPTVLALGGGAYVQAANAHVLNGSGISIWLDTPFETIERRVDGSNHRPLAAEPIYFRELFHSRRDAYAKADYTVRVTSDDPQQTLQSVLTLPLFE